MDFTFPTRPQIRHSRWHGRDIVPVRLVNFQSILPKDPCAGGGQGHAADGEFPAGRIAEYSGAGGARDDLVAEADSDDWDGGAGEGKGGVSYERLDPEVRREGIVF